MVEHQLFQDKILIAIKFLIFRTLILLKFHNLVLVHRKTLLILGTRDTPHESLHTIGTPFLCGIHMNRDEKIGFLLVCLVRTPLQGYENIRRPRKDHLDLGILLFNLFGQHFGHGQVYILLLHFTMYRTRVIASMPCVKNNGKLFLFLRIKRPGRQHKQHQQKQCNTQKRCRTEHRHYNLPDKNSSIYYINQEKSTALPYFKV